MSETTANETAPRRRGATRVPQPTAGPTSRGLTVAAKMLMAERSVTTDDLTERMNRSRAYIAARMTNKRSWDLNDAEGLAQALSVSVETLIKFGLQSAELVRATEDNDAVRIGYRAATNAQRGRY